MRRIIVLASACLFLIGIVFTAVAADKKPSEYKIVLLLPGPINDQSWNATNYAGLVQCNKELGTKMEYLESVQASDFESTFRNYAERGYDLIMAAGTQFDEAANKVASNYPNTTFCVVNGQVSNGPNVAPIFPKEYEASYLAGHYRRLMSAPRDSLRLLAASRTRPWRICWTFTRLLPWASQSREVWLGQRLCVLLQIAGTTWLSESRWLLR